LNQLINVAVAEKLSALSTEHDFRGRAAPGEYQPGKSSSPAIIR
jgi:hypothetical protein